MWAVVGGTSRQPYDAVLAVGMPKPYQATILVCARYASKCRIREFKRSSTAERSTFLGAKPITIKCVRETWQTRLISPT